MHSIPIWAACRKAALFDAAFPLAPSAASSGGKEHKTVQIICFVCSTLFALFAFQAFRLARHEAWFACVFAFLASYHVKHMRSQTAGKDGARQGHGATRAEDAQAQAEEALACPLCCPLASPSLGLGVGACACVENARGELECKDMLFCVRAPFFRSRKSTRTQSLGRMSPTVKDATTI